MQGGRDDDNLVLGRWGRVLDGGDSSGYESEVEVTERLSLGERMDHVVHFVRTTFAIAISLPIAWLP